MAAFYIWRPTYPVTLFIFWETDCTKYWHTSLLNHKQLFWFCIVDDCDCNWLCLFCLRFLPYIIIFGLKQRRQLPSLTYLSILLLSLNATDIYACDIISWKRDRNVRVFDSRYSSFSWDLVLALWQVIPRFHHSIVPFLYVAQIFFASFFWCEAIFVNHFISWYWESSISLWSRTA